MPHNARALLIIFAVAGGLGCRETPRGVAAPPAQLSRGDRLLLVAATIALPPDWIGPSDLPQPDSRGAKLVVAYCRQCHALPTPKAHGAADWAVVVRRMWLRMEGLPESLRVEVPNQSDRSDILEYLTANGLKVATTPLPAGKGRDAFLLACNRCHAAPDPGLHSKEEWPVVLARVERNMKRMNVLSPTGLESEDILSYLQSVAGPMRRTASGSR